MTTNLFEKVNIENLVAENDVILIALSGGADSVFLAEYFKSIQDKYSLTLKAAHIEHGIRGQESIDDCKFVEQYCKESGIECFVLHINVPEEAKNAGKGVEEYSREKRYEFFNSVDCDKIATAHTLSDNIETLIFRLARGTSIKGLCGIPPKRDKIIRPLLNLKGEEIRWYLDENNIRYCVDSTNANNAYNRNHIRNKIIPLFSKLNENYESAFERLIESINEDNDFIEFESDKAFDIACNGNEIEIGKIRKYPIAIQKRIIIRYFAKNSILL
nr:tRNA lysidine(34) synthetase TilS [Eubacterium sp.]